MPNFRCYETIVLAAAISGAACIATLLSSYGRLPEASLQYEPHAGAKQMSANMGNAIIYGPCVCKGYFL